MKPFVSNSIVIVLAVMASSAAGLPQTGVPAAPAGVVAALRRGMVDKDPGARSEALLAAAAVDDDRVAKQVGRALADRDPAVRRTAIRVLRYMGCRCALDELLRAEKHFEKDRRLGPSYYLALGQQGDPRALPVLMHRAWNPASREVFEARMQAVAHIRSPKSVAALFDLMNKFRRGGGRASNRGLVLRSIRLLTGVHEPRSVDEWRAWWRKARSGFEVAEQPDAVSKKELARYHKLWRTPAQERREAEERAKNNAARRKRKRSPRGAAKPGRDGG